MMKTDQQHLPGSESANPLTPAMNDDFWAMLSSENNDLFGSDRMSEAWYGPILSDLNWLQPMGT